MKPTNRCAGTPEHVHRPAVRPAAEGGPGAVVEERLGQVLASAAIEPKSP